MRKFQFAFLLLVISTLFAACSAESSSNANTSRTYSTNTSVTTAKSSAPSERGGSGREDQAVSQQVSLEQTSKSQPTPAEAVIERKIIRNADLTLEADSPDETQAKMAAIADSKGGFVIESQKQTNESRATKTDIVTMTARVPAAKFDESLNEIRQTAKRVVIETVKGQDVTDQFIDTEARLKTQKALEAQFLEIMKQAKTVEETLKVQTEIAKVRGEIEIFEGRKRFLENQSAFSTIKIQINSTTVLSASSSGFFYELGQSISRGFSAAMSFVLVLVTVVITLIPFFIFIVLPTYLLIRYLVRRNNKQKLASEIVKEEIKNE